MALHILKMCVGVDEVEQLVEWQARRREEYAARGEEPVNRHYTRHVPRRATEIEDGGSLYWIMKGFVRARQRIIRIDVLRDLVDGKRCAFVLGPELVRTELQARRPHQGWRYLEPKDAPADLPVSSYRDDALPPEMAAELRQLGLI